MIKMIVCVFIQLCSLQDFSVSHIVEESTRPEAKWDTGTCIKVCVDNKRRIFTRWKTGTHGEVEWNGGMSTRDLFKFACGDEIDLTLVNFTTWLTMQEKGKIYNIGGKKETLDDDGMLIIRRKILFYCFCTLHSCSFWKYNEFFRQQRDKMGWWLKRSGTGQYGAMPSLCLFVWRNANRALNIVSKVQ